MRRAIRVVATLAIIALSGALFIALMPRGYDTDLSRIGKGQPVAVLVHNAEYLASTELMESMNRLRGDYEPAVLFLLADLHVPPGKKFAAEHSANFDTLLLFDADGRRVASHSGDSSETAVRAFLNKYYQ